MPDGELGQFLRAILSGLVGGSIAGGAILLGRHFRGERVWPPPRMQLTSPWILYLGIVVFAGMAVVSFSTGMPIFGSFAVLGSFVYVGLVAAYRRGWRG